MDTRRRPDEEEKDVLDLFGQMKNVVQDPSLAKFDSFFNSEELLSMPPRFRYALVAYAAFWALLHRNDDVLIRLSELKEENRWIGEKMLEFPTMPFQLAHWMMRIISEREEWYEENTNQTPQVSLKNSFLVLKNIPKEVNHRPSLQALCACLLDTISALSRANAMFYFDLLHKKQIASGLRVGINTLSLYVDSFVPSCSAQQWIETSTDQEVVQGLKVLAAHTQDHKAAPAVHGLMREMLLPRLSREPIDWPLSSLWSSLLKEESVERLLPFSNDFAVLWNKASLAQHVEHQTKNSSPSFKRKI